MRAMSASSAGERCATATRTPTFMPCWPRSAGEAGMHFGGGAARPGTGAGVGRPDSGMALGKVFGDGQRIPDHGIAIGQPGHLAGGRKLAEVVGGAGREAVQHLVEGDAQRTHQHPGPQRPRGIVLVGDVQGVHALKPGSFRRA
jgi:hypothetical protein